MSMPNSKPSRSFIIYVAGLGLGVAVGVVVITIRATNFVQLVSR